MKKIILLAFVILSFAESGAQNFNIGAKTGVNFVVLKNQGSKKNINLFNYHVGAVGSFGITEKIAIQPELLYSTQRYSYESFKFYLDYINIPIMADYKIIQGLSLQVGPQFGFNTKKRVKMKGGDDTPGDLDANLDNAETLSIGAGFGAQYKLLTYLFFQARYTFGFTDIYDNSNLKNGVISFSVGYFIF